MISECRICKFVNSGDFVEDLLYWQVDISREFEFTGIFFIRLKRHCISLADLTEDESSEMGRLIQKYSAISYKISKAQRVLAMSLGLSDPHIHFWILPKTFENENEVLLISKAMQKILHKYKAKKPKKRS